MFFWDEDNNVSTFSFQENLNCHRKKYIHDDGLGRG